MRYLKIDTDGMVHEFNAEEADIMALSDAWDVLEVAEHDLWVDDDGLAAATLVTASVGFNLRVPLPAYVLGSSGEKSTNADLTVSELQSLVANVHRH